ncbi:Hydrolase, putative isoform 2 [Capsicum annuum]|nr:Hydrolase, putative isoform 2 [Capsicum annuum]
MRAVETREGASFGALFGSALLLGIISRRRVYYEAFEYEKERNAGSILPFGYLAKTVAAAFNTVCSIEWYTLLALKGKEASWRGSPVRIWRWNGYLIHYTLTGDEGPALLLVHGFGALWSHYRDNIDNIAEGGNRVWAMTLLGFGESEKPNIVYTEVVWAKLLRDFIIEVVREPVHLVGNSIGGYIAAIVTCLWPALAKSVILLNSAGIVVPGYSGACRSDVRETSGAAWLGARFLSLFLRLNLRNTLKSCYPIRSDRADKWLIQEMLRASYDPGVVVVLESIFSFDLSVPLNYLLQGFEKRVLVLQGMKDPLCDSRSRLAMLREHSEGIVIRELNAGISWKALFFCFLGTCNKCVFDLDPLPTFDSNFDFDLDPIPSPCPNPHLCLGLKVVVRSRVGSRGRFMGQESGSSFYLSVGVSSRSRVMVDYWCRVRCQESRLVPSRELRSGPKSQVGSWG